MPYYRAVCKCLSWISVVLHSPANDNGHFTFVLILSKNLCTPCDLYGLCAALRNLSEYTSAKPSNKSANSKPICEYVLLALGAYSCVWRWFSSRFKFYLLLYLGVLWPKVFWVLRQSLGNNCIKSWLNLAWGCYSVCSCLQSWPRYCSRCFW